MCVLGTVWGKEKVAKRLCGRRSERKGGVRGLDGVKYIEVECSV